MSIFTIDLCVNWVRVGECVDGTFDGTLRDLATGEWRLTGSVAAQAFVQKPTTIVATPSYITFPGVVGNYLSVTDAASVDVAGDITLIAHLAPIDWAQSGNPKLIAKRSSTTTSSYRLYLNAGKPAIAVSPDGTDTNQRVFLATVAVGYATGTWKYVAATLDVDNGAAGASARFWTSDDLVAWTQLGATVTSAGITSIFNSTSAVEIGSDLIGTAGQWAGQIDRVIVANGIGAAGIPGGTTVLDVNAGPITDPSAATFTATTGQTVTVNRAGAGAQTSIVVAPLPSVGVTYTLADVNTVRVVRDNTIVFAGYVAPVSNGVGGLEVVSTGTDQQFTLTGPDAWSVLASRIAYPDPATGPPWATGWDVRTGLASTVAATYLAANAGVAATADRVIPGLAIVDGFAGMSGTWSARLQPLDELVQRICNDGAITCRLAVSFAGAVTATLAAPSDRRLTVVLSDQGDLTNIDQINIPASATFVVAGGQGQLTARSFATSGTATGVTRREVFINQSSLSNPSEVQQSANTKRLASAASLTVRAAATDIAASRVVYLDNYDLGDTISLEIATVRYPVIVEAVNVHVGLDRAVIRPVFGPAAPGLLAGLIRDVGDLQSRFDTQNA